MELVTYTQPQKGKPVQQILVPCQRSDPREQEGQRIDRRPDYLQRTQAIFCRGAGSGAAFRAEAHPTQAHLSHTAADCFCPDTGTGKSAMCMCGWAAMARRSE